MDRDLPLFPRLAGDACAKAAVVGTIVAAAVQLELPLADADGSTRMSGHSLRVGGAQGLARAGFPVWSIQLLGRWGTDTVKQYIGDAALHAFTGSVPSPLGDPTDLTDLLSSLPRRRPSSVLPGPTSCIRSTRQFTLALVTMVETLRRIWPVMMANIFVLSHRL